MIESDIIKLCFGTLISVFSYFCVAKIFKNEELNKLTESIYQN